MSPSGREPTVSGTLGPCELAAFLSYVRETFNHITPRTQPRDKNNGVSSFQKEQ